MTLVQILVVLAVIAGVGAVAAGVVRGGMRDPETSVPDVGVPGDRLSDADVGDLRFAVGLRGYRMDQVDAVLDRVATELRTRTTELAERTAELAERDAEIARMREA